MTARPAGSGTTAVAEGPAGTAGAVRWTPIRRAPFGIEID